MYVVNAAANSAITVTLNDDLSAEAARPVSAEAARSAGKGDGVESEYSSAVICECASQNTNQN